MGVINVDTRDRKPIYEQLIDNITALVLRGILKPDEQLPGVRTLAVELAINPNTIQKAYSELERRGITYSIQGRGSFVSDNVGELHRTEQLKIMAELRKCLERSREAGISRDEVICATDEIWRKSNDNG